MTSLQLILLDHAAALVGAAAWFGAGAAVAVRRVRLGRWLTGTAAVVVALRVLTVMLLAGRGWWFVQEKVLLGLPLVSVAALAALTIAGPRLRRARREGSPVALASSVIALLTAGFAALAAFAVTFLAGYPLRWSTALLTISGVGACALVTARVLAPHLQPVSAASDGDRRPDARPGLSRRRFLTVAGGAAVVTVGGAGAGLSLLPGPAVASGGGPAPLSTATVPVSRLRGAAGPAPGGVVRRAALSAGTAKVRLASGRQVDAWTYNGRLPGPAIVATAGDVVEVTLSNVDIDHGVTVHWHGYDVACGEDGVPGLTQPAVLPGEDFVYRFRADQVGTYWYHTHQDSHDGVPRGLYGTLVVHPRDTQPETGDAAGTTAAAPLDLTLPLHTFGGALLIGDEDGPTERSVAPGARVRLRFVNTDSEAHHLALVGSTFHVASVDGRDLNRPDEVEDVAVRLPAGGRHDLVLTMPDAPVAVRVDNDGGGGLRLLPPGVSAAAALHAETDTGGWPDLDLLHYGQPSTPPFDPAEADRHFSLVLDRGLAMVDGRPAFAQTVNGKGHPSIPDQVVAEGDLVRFTVVNRSLETHPWHLHGHAVLVLSRDGVRSSGSPLWVDTFDVRPGEVWEVAFRATNPGVWMNHCHNLPHAHQGMMLRLAYDGFAPVSATGHPGH
ncbi:multicopper oxidase family protein [Intrasporangium sp.]|uniref:multicopper oxidase family protein n=1 Tax=Intrasporangium sp. TaxID=1925024 RepID=UPI00293AC38A|nr:multicopper oxidase family protein [Intrasporangium sp.]MDV3220312.1 multicopper oxidase family protein [Intrasporangium sp.]